MDLSEIISGIERFDKDFLEKARERTNQLVMPQRALGDLHVLGERLCGILRTLKPSVERKAFLVMAGDHGIAGSGVSAYPQVVTGEMVRGLAHDMEVTSIGSDEVARSRRRSMSSLMDASFSM